MRHNGLHIIAGACALALAYGCTEIHPIDPTENAEEQEVTPGTEETVAVGLPAPITQLGPITLTGKEEELALGINQFAFRLLSQLYSGGSMVISPLSLELVLSMAADGADGNTQDQIRETVSSPGRTCLVSGREMEHLDGFNKHLLVHLPAVDTTVRMNCVNALIADNNAPLLDSYVSSVENNYYATVRNMDFNDFGKVQETVNDWSNRTTNGLIPTILDQNSRGDALALLINLLYMKAQWTTGFDKERQVLKSAEFKSASGQTVLRDYLNAESALAYYENETFTAVRLGLGRWERFSFTILLPKADDGLPELVEQLSANPLPWRESIRGMTYKIVAFSMPMFKTESSYRLREVLKELGIRDAFDGYKADFSRVFQTGARIDEVIQKAKMVVNTDGIEGAAATTIGFVASGLVPDPIQFQADHPFIYIITEDSSRTILFLGIYDGD